jgi:hypothetical protein
MAAPTKEMKFCKANFKITEVSGQIHFERLEGNKPGYIADMETYPTLKEACIWVVKCEETPNGDHPKEAENKSDLDGIMSSRNIGNYTSNIKGAIESTDSNYNRSALMSCAQKFPTDKIKHGYIPIYEENLPDTINSLLEIGCWKGNSLRMWRELLPDAQLTTLDLFEEFKEPKDIKGLKCFKGNQMFQDVLDYVDKASNYDVVIDDGSHGSKDQWMVIETFSKPGTVVVIEDLHCCTEAFWRQGLTFEETILGSIKAGNFPYRHKLFLDKIVFVYAD